MHGKFPNYLDKDHVDVELTFELMKHTGLKRKTEGLITAAQDQALNTRYYSKHIIKQGTTDRCRMCHTQTRNCGTHHIRVPYTSSRSVPQQAQPRSCPVAPGHIQALWHQVEAECCYQHKPEQVMENEKETILWDSPVITDRQVP